MVFDSAQPPISTRRLCLLAVQPDPHFCGSWKGSGLQNGWSVTEQLVSLVGTSIRKSQVSNMSIIHHGKSYGTPVYMLWSCLLPVWNYSMSLLKVGFSVADLLWETLDNCKTFWSEFLFVLWCKTADCSDKIIVCHVFCLETTIPKGSETHTHTHLLWSVQHDLTELIVSHSRILPCWLFKAF